MHIPFLICFFFTYAHPILVAFIKSLAFFVLPWLGDATHLHVCTGHATTRLHCVGNKETCPQHVCSHLLQVSIQSVAFPETLHVWMVKQHRAGLAKQPTYVRSLLCRPRFILPFCQQSVTGHGASTTIHSSQWPLLFFFSFQLLLDRMGRS